LKTSWKNIVIYSIFLLTILLGSTFLSRHYSQVLGQSEYPVSIYLPLVTRDFPFLSVFGATITPISSQGGLELMVQAGVQWTRPCSDGILLNQTEEKDPGKR
jgi:hypothetical protein